jgi:hypothetical protein
VGQYKPPFLFLTVTRSTEPEVNSNLEEYSASQGVAMLQFLAPGAASAIAPSKG